MGTYSRGAFAALILLLLILQSAYALPNSATNVAGNDCRQQHSLIYGYSVSAPKSVQVGETFTISLEFKLNTESRLMRAPTTTTATLSGTNVEILVNGKQSYDRKADWQVKSTAPGTASMSFATEFLIIGDDSAHRGYRATFKDRIDFTITVTDKPAPEPPPNNPPPLQNQTSGDNQSTANQTSPTLPEQQTNDKPSSQNNTQIINQIFDVELPPEPDQTSWIMTRILGLIAYSLLFFSVFIALLKKAQYSKRFLLLFKYHHDISILSLLFALFHGLFNVFDKYTWSLSLEQVFLPRFGTNTQIIISAGIITFYIMLLITITSLRASTIKKMGFKNWKYIHMASYIGFIFVFFHAVLLGADLTSGFLSYPFWLSGFLVLMVSADLLICKILGVKNE